MSFEGILKENEDLRGKGRAFGAVSDIVVSLENDSEAELLLCVSPRRIDATWLKPVAEKTAEEVF